jgi:hypothetical protein
MAPSIATAAVESGITSSVVRGEIRSESGNDDWHRGQWIAAERSVVSTARRCPHFGHGSLNFGGGAGATGPSGTASKVVRSEISSLRA